MVNIVLFGAPGCGKGTQAQRLKAHYGIDHVSTGEVIRDEIRRGTELGQSMEAYIKAGQLAPDEIVIGMIDHYVTGHMNAAGCIFDGFPRTTVQAEEFDKILAGHGLKVDVMIGIPPEILHKCVEDLWPNYLQVLESESFREGTACCCATTVAFAALFCAPPSERYGRRIYREHPTTPAPTRSTTPSDRFLDRPADGQDAHHRRHGAGTTRLATATVCALMNMPCVVTMGGPMSSVFFWPTSGRWRCWRDGRARDLAAT